MGKQTISDDTLFDASDIEEQADKENDESPVEVTNGMPTGQKATSGESADSEENNQGTEETTDEDANFLTKKGINLDHPLSERERRLTQMYRNAEKGFHEKSQEKARIEHELARSQQDLSPDSQALSEVRSLRTELTVANWKKEKNITPEVEQKMMEYISSPLVNAQGNIVVNQQTGQPVPRGVLVVNGALSLDDVFTLVGGSTTTPDAALEVGGIKEQMRNEIRKEMAARQSIGGVRASATDPAQFGKTDAGDPFMDALLGGD
jgi:hypothetical protein